MAQNTHYSYWSPTQEGMLPDTTDLDFGAWYILDSGEIDETTYTEGDWLIYVCDKRGTLDERHYWRTSKGVVLFDKDGSSNLPDPGTYTKVRLDNKGNVIEGMYLDYDDMPQQLKDKVEKMSEEELERITKKVISEVFINNELNPVQFVWNDQTKTLGISLELEEKSIGINEYGQLFAKGGGGSGTPGEGSSSDDPCGGHAHQADDIIGLEDFIKEHIKASTVKDVVASSLEDVVDGDTIIINKNGQLSAIAAGTQKHHHTMSDITDLDPLKADTWASNQSVHKISDAVDLDNGAVLMSTLTIGEILVAFNQLFNEHKKLIDKAAHENLTIQPSDPNDIDCAKFEAKSKKVLECYNVQTQEIQKCLTDVVISTKDIIYNDFRQVCAVVDGVEDPEDKWLRAYNVDDDFFSKGVYGKYTVTYVGDAYPHTPIFQGFYSGFSFDYNPGELSEGHHSIYFLSKDTLNDRPDIKSDTIEFDVCTPVEPSIDMSSVEIKLPDFKQYVSGVRTHQGQEVLFNYKILGYNRIYAPVVASQLMIDYGDNIWEDLVPTEYHDGYISYSITKKVPDGFKGTMSVTVRPKGWRLAPLPKVELTSEYINSDSTGDIESKYRVHPDALPDGEHIITFADYLSTVPLTDEAYINECRIEDGIAKADKTDLSEIKIGPNLSSKPDKQWISLKFASPDIPNFYFDLLDKDGNVYETNKDGSLKGIDIYAAVSSIGSSKNWVDCNKAYPGYGSWDGSSMFNGQDLFRSDKVRHYVTFGRNSTLKSGDLYLVMGVTSSVDLKVLITSIEESLNERS